MTDFRALCAELLEAIEDDAFFRTNEALRFSKAVLSARTALADSDARDLRAARRPKPPSLKEQALALVNSNKPYLDDTAMDTIRRALEALPDA